MAHIQPITWQKFSKEYLTEVHPTLPIQAKKLYRGMYQYLKAHPEIKLSREGQLVLKRYAFHKAIKKFNNGSVLTQKQCEKVFKNYQRVVCNLTLEISTDEEFKKPPKPEIHPGLARLAIFSTSILEKHLEPKYKAYVQAQLKMATKVSHVAKFFFEEDKHFNPQKKLMLELIARKLVYYNPKEGERFHFPYEGKMIEYQADVIPLWMGINAYGFKPVDPNEKSPPILAFTGTRPNPSTSASLPTIVADFDPRGVGYIAYANGKAEITKWLSKTKGDVLLTGHSLGGALARYAAIDHSDLVDGAYTFAAPGISIKHGKKLEQIKKDPAKKQPHFYNFNHSEDPIPTFGQSFGKDNYEAICAVEKTVDKELAAKRKIHQKRLFGRKIVLLCKKEPRKSLSVMMQRALFVIPFIFLMAVLLISRALFGVHSSKPYVSFFGPVRWAMRAHLWLKGLRRSMLSH